MARFTVPKTKKERIFELLDKDPEMTLADLSFHYPSYNKNTIKHYRWEYENRFFPVKRLKDEVKIILEVLRYKIFNEYNIRLNKREKQAITIVERWIERIEEREAPLPGVRRRLVM